MAVAVFPPLTLTLTPGSVTPVSYVTTPEIFSIAICPQFLFELLRYDELLFFAFEFDETAKNRIAVSFIASELFGKRPC